MRVVKVDESYTSKTCSLCGKPMKVGVLNVVYSSVPVWGKL